MRRLLAGLVGALTAVALPAAAGAAPAGAAPDDGLDITAVDAAAHPEVEVTVTGPGAVAGEDVPAGAFRLSENGQGRPVEVRGGDTDPLEVAVVVDASGSMSGRPLAEAQVAAADFVTQLPGARVAVVEYATQPRVVSPLSRDTDAHLDAIAALRAGGRTATFDAIEAALGAFSGDDARRAIVLLTDGEDNESAATMDDVAPQVVEAGAGFHAVEFRTDSADREALDALAAATGGSVASADDADELAGVYDAIATRLTAQHVLRYTSEAHGSAELLVEFDHDGVRDTATWTVPLPEAASTASDAGAEDAATRVLRVDAVDAKEHPTVAVTVVAPRVLAEHELAADHFELFEATRPRDLTVAPVTGRTQEVVVAIDTSGSMKGEALEAAKEAAADFVARLPEQARVAVLGFSGEPYELHPLTADRTAAAASIAGLQAGGTTALYDTVEAAAAVFGDDPATTRTVIALSDGGDTASSTALGAAAERLADAGATLYAVELETPETDRAALEALAEPAGGVVVSADDPGALADVFDRVAVDLGNLYVLTYRSSMHGDTELRITVEADGVRAETTHTVTLPGPPLLQSIMGSGWGLVVGAALCYVALALTILLLLAPRQPRARIAGAARERAGQEGTALAALATRASSLAERGLRRRGWSATLNAALERAGIALRPGEFAVLGVGAAMGAAAVGLLLSGVLVAGGLALVAAVGCRAAVKVMTSRRQGKFAAQLSDTLQLLAGSLRAGYSLLQAVDAVAREADSPTAEEFRRLVLETRLGRDLTTSLQLMAERMGNEDFEWVVQAIAIHREVGGDLADVLDTVAGTIRERDMIRRQVKSLSAEGRLSAYILLALPFAVGAFFMVANPGYLPQLTESLAGWIMVIVGGVLMAVGAVWLRKIVRIVF